MVLKKGSAGKVYFGTPQCLNIGSWKLDIEIKDEDISAFGDDWDKFDIIGAGASFSFEGQYNPDDTGVAALETAVLGVTTSHGAVKLYQDATKYFYMADAIISKYGLDTKVRGFIKLSVSGKANGAVTKV